MNWTIKILLLLALPGAAWSADTRWALERSTLAYHISHPLHESEGVSHAARGKGTCHEGQCDFLIAAPVKSFESGDSNRDLHMLQVVKGAQFPMVVVRTRMPESNLTSGTFHADLEIQFAGQTVSKQASLEVKVDGKEARITGTIPCTLQEFKIDPPSLLALPVKNEMPVKVDMVWRQP